MSNFTCTITYPDGLRHIVWAPTTPTVAHPCMSGDHITFLSPEVMSHIHFGIDTPFEQAPALHEYTVPQVKGLELTINERAKGVFKFNCMPNGAIIKNAGGEIPVHSGN